ncbi:MAG: hypothetical protein II038_08490, partial [Lachnospiraceae bacterium]|nr:hypothetical protein [Lachnospiraceae bacterium]
MPLGRAAIGKDFIASICFHLKYFSLVPIIVHRIDVYPSERIRIVVVTDIDSGCRALLNQLKRINNLFIIFDREQYYLYPSAPL